MKRFNLLVILSVVALFAACHPQKVAMEAAHPISTQYLNDEGDGSITVRAYGQGRHRGDALEQAYKNAVRDVMLNGVDVPGNALLSRPLIMEVNAEEKYATFLNDFFKDDGPYVNFFSKRDRRHNTNEKSWGGAQLKLSTTVRVLRSDLEQYLRECEIIK